MKNLVKILLFTVFFCILPTANLFALSKEATEAIEAMRARLRLLESNTEQPEAVVSCEEDYVPGRELSAVLARIRRERFESEKRTKQVHIKQTPKEEKIETPVEVKPITEVTEDNIIVANDEEASNNQPVTESAPSEEEQEVIAVPAVKSEEPVEEEHITASEPETANKTSQDEIIIIEAMEADDSEAWSVPINNKTSEQPQKPDTVAAQKADNNEYVTGQLLERSIRRIRHSQRRNTPASSELDSALEDYEKRLARKQARNSKDTIATANEEIEELFNNPEKQNAYNSKKETSEQEENKIDDDKFNDYISKYDFKMPENYRIIVE